MAKLNVQITIKRPVTEVFAYISDHKKFLNGLVGTTAKLVAPGQTERDGLGCIREVRVGKRIRYLEEITLWEPPNVFEYQIRESSMPIRHFGSRIEFVSRENGTDVAWKSHFDIPTPMLGWVIGAYMKSRYVKAFSAMLSQAKIELERS